MSDTTPRNEAALQFLLSRRSRPYKTLSNPIPQRDEIETLLTAAARTPDHGKLEPFRFVVLTDLTMQRLAGSVVSHGETIGLDPDAIEKMRFQLAAAPLAIAVIASPVTSPKVPEIEQVQAATGACLALLNAALAAGWGANWLTGWAAHDAKFLQDHMGLSAGESLIGWVHIGTASNVPPERPRPDLAAITTWVDS